MEENWKQYAARAAKHFERLKERLEAATDALEEALLTHIFDDEEEATGSGYAGVVNAGRELLDEIEKEENNP